MSTNGINSCEDTEMAECDGEKVVTMMDVLKEQEDFEEDANAVLGASDDKNCTYSKGYIKRQAIYACMTCCEDAKDDPNKRAGVCLACSLTCHENHDLVELYTKRNFRCDCGNPKFNSHPCQFTPGKTDLNEENIYNQNFSGVYCTCHRPYPDPESPAEQEMIQCIICEDWLHSSHLDAVVPPNELYSEMICKACMDRNEFLHDYSELVVNKEDGDVDILNATSELNGATKVNGNVDTDILVDENIDSNAKSENLLSVKNHNEDNDKQGTDMDTNVESKTVAEETKEIEQSDDTKPEYVTEKVQEESDNQPVANDEEQISNKTSESDNVDSEKDTEKSDKEPESCTAESTMDTESKEDNDLPVEIKPTSENTDGQKEEKQIEETNLNERSDQTSHNKNEKDSEGVIPSSETTAAPEEVPTPMETSDIPTPAEKNSTPLETNENPDNRTQEQVDEDLLLADPVEANSAENKASSDATPSDSTTSSNEVTKENKSESQSMDVNEKEKAEQKETISGDSELTTINANIQEQSGSSNEGQNPADVTSETENKKKLIEETNDTENKENKTDANKIEKTSDTENEKNNTDVNEIEKTSDTENEKNKTDVNEIENQTEVTNTAEIEKNDIKDTSDSDVKTATAVILKRRLSSEADSEDSNIKKPKLDGIQCIRPKGVKKIYKGATFWPSNFRNKLCTCNECISMYKDLSVLFLTDPEDTVTAYERLGKEKTNGKPVSQYEKGMAALSSLGHVQQINALTEYGKMRDKLLEFLKSFKDRKVIVKEEDIKAFFAGMKPVREPDGVYFCR